MIIGEHDSPQRFSIRSHSVYNKAEGSNFKVVRPRGSGDMLHPRKFFLKMHALKLNLRLVSTANKVFLTNTCVKFIACTY